MDEVMIRRDDGLLWLKLNRPAKKNALTRAMYAALADALTEADDDDSVRAAVITAEGADFCAGNDIFDFAQDVPALMADGIDPDAMPVFRFLKALTFFSKPLVAGLQGQAVGVGVTLLLHCDLVVAGEDIRLRLPFLHLGLVPEAGSSLLLPRRIGHARAFEWLSQNLAVDAATARDWGLVNRVVPVAEVEAEAEAMARSLVRLPPTAVRETKRLMRDPDALWPVVEAEGRIFRRLLTSPEAQAAFAAFLKR